MFYKKVIEFVTTKTLHVVLAVTLVLVAFMTMNVGYEIITSNLFRFNLSGEKQSTPVEKQENNETETLIQSTE